MLLRPFLTSDAESILTIYGPVVAESTATFETEVPALNDFTERLARIAGRFPFWVAVDPDGSVLGYAYGTTHRERIAYQWAVETSVYVAPRAHRQGVGRALYSTLLPSLAERGFVWAYGVITLPNDASVALHAACGYESFATYTAAGQKFGQWCDVHWMCYALNAARPGMAEPRFRGL
ncbi:MAG: N-acetyltransferase family protein [Bacteroidetes bacterium]|nr:N-acetyltransferase family protein [Bacteroidota bacterium]